MEINIDQPSINSMQTDYYFFIVRVTAERHGDWPWHKSFGPSMFGLLEQDA